MEEWIEWSVTDPDDLVARAACQVVRGSTEFLTETDSSWEGTLCDRRMGPVQRNESCATCGQSSECPGHWGVLPLAHPVLPAHFVPHVKRALGKKCLSCGSPRTTATPTKKCSTCDCVLGSVKWNAETQMFVWTQTLMIKNETHVVQKRLRAHDTIRLLDEEKKMFWETIVVLPPCARPYHRSPRGMECDHLTTLYARILKANGSVRALANESDFRTDEVVAALAKTVNELCSEKTKSTKPSKEKKKKRRDDVGGVAQRLKGKEGRFRQNLLGGTTFFCSRAVVTGASELRVDEIGVPADVANALTVPVTVSELNHREALKAIEMQEIVRVQRGAEQHEVTPHTVSRIKVWIQPGDVAHRRLRNGDVVLVNRQPSLHRHSMMALRVVVVPFKTMRLNPVLCKAYNADFDGDEMNIFVPQTLQAQIEAMELMGVPRNVVSSQTSLPTMGLIMDAVLGCYLLADAFMDRADAMQFLSVAQIWDLPSPVLDTKQDGEWVVVTQKWSGYALLSQLFPRDFNYDVEGVEIRAGFITSGRLTKKHMGAESNSIVDVMCKTCGAETVVDFLSRVHCSVNWWMSQTGFSVSCSDAQCFHETCDELVARSFAEPNPLLLRGVRDTMGTAVVARLASQNDNFVKMVEAGSKGSKTNLVSMVLAVGTQVVDGHLPPLVGGRAVPHFTAAETTQKSAARGFVANNFRTGLNVSETFFCAEWGRGSIVDTNGKTADVGYVSRKLMRTLENCVVAHDGTVRYQHRIIQFRYGGTGYAPERLFRVGTDLLPFLPLDVDRHVLGGETPTPTKEWMSALPYTHHWGDVVGVSAPAPVVGTHQTMPESVSAHIETYLRSRRARGWTTKQLQRARTYVSNCVERAKIEAGEPVGCRAAHGIGQPCTQMTLNTFHHNGLSFSAVSGQHRIQEILHATRNDKTPVLTLRVRDPRFANMVAKKLRRLDIREFVADSRVVPYDETVEREMPMWERIWFVCFGRKWSWDDEVAVQTNPKKRKNVTVPKRPTHVLELRLRADYLDSTHTSLRSIRESILTLQHVVDVTHTSTHRFSPDVVVRVFVTCPKHTLPYAVMRRVMAHPMQGHACFGAWSNVSDSGTKIEIACASKTDAQRCIWMSQMIPDDVVDHAATTCSSVFATFRACGIEAARQCIMRELQKNFETDGASMVSQSHLSLLADTMCYSGFPVGIHSRGVATVMGSALMCACYERSLQTIASAAVSGRKDASDDVSSRVAMGRAAAVGIAAVGAKTQLVPDHDAMRSLVIEDTFVSDANGMQEGSDVEFDHDHDYATFSDSNPYLAPVPAPAPAPAPAPVPAPFQVPSFSFSFPFVAPALTPAPQNQNHGWSWSNGGW